jgi:hypothetical protein
MKFGIAFLPALAVVACGRVAAADEIDKAIVVKVADLVVVEPAPQLRRHLHVRPRTYPYPAACESVLFPRSPLCAGRPASYGYYAPYPWNNYWLY